MHVPKSNKQPLSDERDAGGYEFRFRRPTWLGGNWDTSSVNSIVLIAPDGRSVIAESHEKIKRSIAAGFTMTTKAVQKILTIPLHKNMMSTSFASKYPYP